MKLHICKDSPMHVHFQSPVASSEIIFEDRNREHYFENRCFKLLTMKRFRLTKILSPELQYAHVGHQTLCVVPFCTNYINFDGIGGHRICDSGQNRMSLY